MKDLYIVEFKHGDGTCSYLNYNEDWYNTPYTTCQENAFNFDSEKNARDGAKQALKILNKNVFMNIVSCNIYKVNYNTICQFSVDFFKDT